MMCTIIFTGKTAKICLIFIDCFLFENLIFIFKFFAALTQNEVHEYCHFICLYVNQKLIYRLVDCQLNRLYFFSQIFFLASVGKFRFASVEGFYYSVGQEYSFGIPF